MTTVYNTFLSEAASAAARELSATFGSLEQLFQTPQGSLVRRPPYPEAWSIAEHLEHVSLVNHFLLLTIGKGCAKALRRAQERPVPAGESDLAILAPIAVPGAFEWPPPPHMIPTGAAPLDSVRALLESQRRTCLDLLSRMPAGEGRLCTIRMSVHGLGRLDMYQWLYFLAQHARYHLALMEKARQPLR